MKLWLAASRPSGEPWSNVSSPTTNHWREPLGSPVQRTAKQRRPWSCSSHWRALWPHVRSGIRQYLFRVPWGWEQVILAIAVGVYGALFVAVVAMAASVYLPRTPRSGVSLIYFEDISAMSYEEFESRARKMTPADIERQLLQQTHTVSRIASAKMNRVRLTYLISAPSVGLWIALLVWGSV